jgi:hypothetical protein
VHENKEASPISAFNAIGLENKTTLILHYGHEKPDQETPAHDKENPDQSTVIGLSWKQQAACLNAKQVVEQQSDDN